MAKIIKYKYLSGQTDVGTEENPQIEDVVFPVEIVCKTQAVFDGNYPIAEKEAVPGTLTVEGEFEPEPEDQPTQLDVIEAQITYTAMMTDTLLTGV